LNVNESFAPLVKSFYPSKIIEPSSISGSSSSKISDSAFSSFSFFLVPGYSS
jgi:hypothetical protein